MGKKSQISIILRNILLLFAAGILLLPGCQIANSEPDGETGQTTAVTTEDIDRSDQTDSDITADRADDLQRIPDQPGGILRLWRPAQDSMNPLLVQSRPSRAVYDLVFEGLFQIDAAQLLQPRLIEQMSVSADQLQVDLTLRSGLRFHDGQPVRADDLAASIQFIMDHAESSPYAAGLAMVSSVSSEDGRTVRLLLDTADTWLAYALTFPILPASYLTSEDSAFLSGTGLFRILGWTGNQVMQLENTQATAGSADLMRIDVRPYRDISAAMQAFSDDQIDLIYLPADVYQAYRPRTNLRFDVYSGNRFIFLALQTENNRLFSDSDAFLFMKQLLQQSFHNQVYHEYGEIASIPLAMSSGLLEGHRPDVSAVLDQLRQSGQIWRQPEQPLDLIWPEYDPVRQDLANEIGLILTDNDIEWQGRALPEEQFTAEISAGNYDLALLGAVLPDRPDPRWFYLADFRQPADGSDAPEQADTLEYDHFLDLLEQIWRQPPADSFSGEDLAAFLSHIAARSQWHGLIIQSEALLYGDRVLGHGTPDRYNPYEGIEALWVWSTQ